MNEEAVRVIIDALRTFLLVMAWVLAVGHVLLAIASFHRKIFGAGLIFTFGALRCALAGAFIQLFF